MREETILRKLRSRDPAGLEALMERYLPYVSAVVWGILRGAMTAEDGEEVASDVFLAAWEQSGDLRAGHVKAWLGAVARNKAKNKLRQMGRSLPLEEDALDLPGPDDPAGRWSGRRSGRWSAGRWTACRARTGRSSCATTTTPRASKRWPPPWS